MEIKRWEIMEEMKGEERKVMEKIKKYKEKIKGMKEILK